MASSPGSRLAWTASSCNSLNAGATTSCPNSTVQRQQKMMAKTIGAGSISQPIRVGLILKVQIVGMNIGEIPAAETLFHYIASGRQ